MIEEVNLLKVSKFLHLLWSNDPDLLEEFFSSEIEMMVGLFGLEIKAMEIKAMTLKITPSPIMMRTFSSNPSGVYFS